ncbi:MAG: macro domain-containing protein [Thermoanaerobaculales bacterium]|nr:macro domain-containing protein [Thermoanaerobaculales bacterium]
MDPRILAEHVGNHYVLQAVLGDMTAERVDAIVNAANSNLAHGGGLAGAIIARGGAVIQEESDKLAPVATGNAAVTSAGNLPSRWVIHAVGPIWGEGNEEASLRSAVRASLDRAAKLGATSIALPAISTGIFGYPKQEGTTTIVEEARSWLDGHPDSSLTTVRFTAFDELTAELFADAIRVLATFMPKSGN